MARFILTAIATLLVSLAASQGHAQQLWNGTTVGMQPDEVRTLLASINPDIQYEEAGDGFTAQPISIAGYDSKITASFEDSGLARVSVFIGSTDEPTNQHVSIVNRLIEERYGSPRSCEFLTHVNKRCVWFSAGTKVEGTFIFNQFGGFVSLIYTSGTAPAANL